MTRIYQVEIVEKGTGPGAVCWERRSVAAKNVADAITKALPKRRRRVPLEVRSVVLEAQAP